MEKKRIRLGLLGLGTVGSGVVQVLRDNARVINRKVGAELVLVKALVHNANKVRPGLEDVNLVTDIDDIVQDPEIDIVVELIGGIHPAREYMIAAMEAKKSVVTANKDVVAQFGQEMFETAAKYGVDFLYEASVGGGIPIITPFKECLTANRFTEIMGIVNGTTNYMLTKMAQDGAEYEEVLREAQSRGYAEADPTADVEGLDAARKAAILASLAFNMRVTLNDVSVEGISKITKSDISYAKELGYTLKLLAVGKLIPDKGVDVRVHPALLPSEHPLASVNGVFNAIFVRGNAIGDAMFYGRGAGGRPTASAVIADIIEAGRDILNDSFGRIDFSCFESKMICPLNETESSYYVRMLVDDEPGVLGAVAMSFAGVGVSLKSVIQSRQIGDQAELVIITHTVKHANIMAARAALTALHGNPEIGNIIRVESASEVGL